MLPDTTHSVTVTPLPPLCMAQKSRPRTDSIKEFMSTTPGTSAGGRVTLTVYSVLFLRRLDLGEPRRHGQDICSFLPTKDSSVPS